MFVPCIQIVDVLSVSFDCTVIPSAVIIGPDEVILPVTLSVPDGAITESVVKLFSTISLEVSIEYFQYSRSVIE